MSFRISPVWWPALAVASPVIAPWLLITNRRFQKDRAQSAELNRARIREAKPLELPVLKALELTVLVEWVTREGFRGDAGVSYLLKTDLGALLCDVGMGPASPTLAHNVTKLGLSLDQVDALAISHLHLDHMGGLAAQRAGRVTVPDDLIAPGSRPCFVPSRAEAKGFRAEWVQAPRMLCAGIASTGPLARALFIMGHTEEQALLARVKDKGLVIVTGCGHPTIEVILEMVRQLSDAPLYAIAGGLHFPVTGSRGAILGIQPQAIIGTGKPPWQRVTDQDLSRTIAAINDAAPDQVYLSGHDTCDHALARMQDELTAESEVLQAGATYRL
jgi:7,8-dihydropterin-6-yl-methyl-4-(beta-D-ribofuranosyl)aminobenzene 5'-phosphate synthase